MALSRFAVVFLGILFYSFSCFAQTNIYLVHFTDKNNSVYVTTQADQFLSSKALARRARYNIPVNADDLPVNETYLNAVRAKGAKVRYSLRWMNVAVVEADNAIMTQVLTLPFVFTSYQVKRTSTDVSSKPLAIAQRSGNSEEVASIYGYSYQQNRMVGVELLHENQLHGEGMLIAVFDEGFQNYTTHPAFQSILNRNGILFTEDIVGSDFVLDDIGSHGTAVFSIIAAYDPGKMIGPAYKADFMLFRTEDGTSESPLEELNWARGAEIADSAGVDIIHASLAYSTFDNSIFNYGYASMDGNTTIVTEAADAAGYRGILVVCSAGNEGTNSWHYIAAPADGDSVLSVGATDNIYQPAYFSSFGPSYDGRHKPEVSAMGFGSSIALPSGNYTFSNGTSFSAPLISGFAACLWQENPELSNMQLIKVIREAGHIYPNYNTQLGYGVPDYHRARFQIKNGFSPSPCILAPNPVKQGDWVEIYLGEPFRNKETIIKVYNTVGQQMADYTYTADQVRESIDIPTNALPNGMYTIEMTTIFTVVRMKFQIF